MSDPRCRICNFSPKGKRDFERHLDVVHHITRDDYQKTFEQLDATLASLGHLKKAAKED